MRDIAGQPGHVPLSSPCPAPGQTGTYTYRYVLYVPVAGGWSLQGPRDCAAEAIRQATVIAKQVVPDAGAHVGNFDAVALAQLGKLPLVVRRKQQANLARL